MSGIPGAIQIRSKEGFIVHVAGRQTMTPTCLRPSRSCVNPSVQPAYQIQYLLRIFLHDIDGALPAEAFYLAI